MDEAELSAVRDLWTLLFSSGCFLMVVLKVKSLKLQILVNSAADADTGSSVDFAGLNRS